MEQSKIWDHFQGSEANGDIFAGSSPRYVYLASRIAASERVLNIGVGRGGLEKLLIDRGANVSSLDPGVDAIDGLRLRLGMGDRAQVGVSQAMPFPDRSFDVVVMSEVLEHLSDDVLVATLDEVARVLTPTGRFIGTVPHNEVLDANATVCPHCGERFHRWGHVQSFTPERLSQLLKTTHFGRLEVSVRAFPDWHRSGLGNFAKSLVRHVLGRLGSPIAFPNIYFEAHKR